MSRPRFQHVIEPLAVYFADGLCTKQAIQEQLLQLDTSMMCQHPTLCMAQGYWVQPVVMVATVETQIGNMEADTAAAPVVLLFWGVHLVVRVAA